MTNELEARKKKRKQRRRRRRLLSFLVFVLTLIYLPALWNWFLSSNYEINAIRNATLEITTPVKGVFIRKELSVASPGDGVLIPTVQFGEKVSKGNEIVSYIQSDLKDVVENYRQMELDILKRVVMEYDNSAGKERDQWHNAIETQIAKLTGLSNSGNMRNIDSIRIAMDNVLQSKARAMLENTVLISKMKNEKDELDRLRSSINNSVRRVYSPVSGVVSYSVDDPEGIFSPDKMGSLTIEAIIQEAEAEEALNKWITPAEIYVKRDEVFCKVVENDEAWIVFTVNEKDGQQIKVEFEKAKMEGRDLTYQLEIDGIEDYIPVTLETVGQPENGIMKMTAKINMYIEQILDKRGFKGNLILQQVTGMKVPLRSLFNENNVDNTADIAVVERDRAVFKRVKIIGRQDSYAIIENIDPTDEEKCVYVFDLYLVNPKNVVEGQVVEK